MFDVKRHIRERVLLAARELKPRFQDLPSGANQPKSSANQAFELKL